MTMQLSFLEARSERDRIVGTFQENHRTYLEALRGFARDIARRQGEVSVDDVRAECAARDFPMPAEIGADERVFGALFKSKDFVPVAQRLSRRPERVARAGVGASYVTVYRVA